MQITSRTLLRSAPGRGVLLLAFLGVCLAGGLGGCRDEFQSELDRNRAPDTYLTGFPAESTTTIYRVHLYWYGNDLDGKVVGFEYAITDSVVADEDTLTYRYTTKTDSIFLFPVGRTEQVMGHRFYIRAIDDEGATDPDPAWTFFAASDLAAPEPFFTRREAWDPNGTGRMEITSTNPTVPTDTVPAGWNVIFHWGGRDADAILNESGELEVVGQVTAFEHWLVPRQAIPILGDLADTVAVYDDLESARYQFNLRAIDDAGFSGLDPIVRTFVWNLDPVTRFETGLHPETGEPTRHFFATSDAWGGEALEFFDGDTLPLVDLGERLASITVRAPFEAYDPDDVLGGGVTGFQYRTGPGLWLSGVDVANEQVLLEGLLTSDLILELRCQDAYGRRDGSPATMRISVNRAPVLVDTIDASGPEPELQEPYPGQVFSLEDLEAEDWRLDLKVLAVDPDSTTRRFGYRFRAGGYLFSSERRPGTGAPAIYFIDVPDDWRTPGEYAIDVRIRERTTESQQREADQSIPIEIVP